MKDLLLGQEPSYPFFSSNESGYGDTVVFTDSNNNRVFLPFNRGISTRLLIAKDAMCAMLSNSNANRVYEDVTKVVAESFRCADELLKQENEKNN